MPMLPASAQVEEIQKRSPTTRHRLRRCFELASIATTEFKKVTGVEKRFQHRPGVSPPVHVVLHCERFPRSLLNDSLKHRVERRLRQEASQSFDDSKRVSLNPVNFEGAVVEAIKAILQAPMGTCLFKKRLKLGKFALQSLQQPLLCQTLGIDFVHATNSFIFMKSSQPQNWIPSNSLNRFEPPNVGSYQSLT